jgi:flavin-dependent dehydrogenase
MHDILVCGAGPAGSISALVLARAGARVRIVDRARFPRDKLCGDTVNPGALAILERLGVADVANTGLAIDGMVVSDASGVRRVGRYRGHRGRALRRAALDGGLLDAAVRAGAEFDEGVVVREPLVEQDAVAGVLVAGADGASRPLRARIVIAADGASSRLARALRLARHAVAPRRWAVGAYFEQVAFPAADGRYGEMHIRRGRYVGVAPMPGGIANVCVVTADRAALRDPSALLWSAVRNDAMLADRFCSARLVAKPVCIGPLAVDADRSGISGLLLAGDAAGFIDPMTGDGLRFAFRGAELAASAALTALDRGDRDAHAALMQARRREFAVKWRFNRSLRAVVASPAAMRMVAAGATVAPALIDRLVRYAGDVGK